jgi:antitoxin component YwqK of YwqJK toxin-antitoxin module
MTARDFRIDRYRDGSVRAKGPLIDGRPIGYWEWFREDGSRSQAGVFRNGKPSGDWKFYNGDGSVRRIQKLP